MTYDKLFESVLDDFTADDLSKDSAGTLAGDIQQQNDQTLDSRNLPRTDRFTQMMAFTCGLKTGVKPVPGIIKQELDKFERDCSDVLEQTPEVRDYCVCVLTAYEIYKNIDSRIRIITNDDANNAGGRMAAFRLNFCVCWNHLLKNPRTVRLLMRAFNDSLRNSEFLIFDNMCCRIAEGNHWNGKYWVRDASFDDYISIQQGLSEVVKDYQQEFWNIYNLYRFLCQGPKSFYNLRKQFSDYDYSMMMWKHMLWAVGEEMRLFSFSYGDSVSEYIVPEDGAVSKLIGSVVGPQVLNNEYQYAVVCAKPASTSDSNTRETYYQISGGMGKEPVQDAIRAQLYANKAVIRKVMFMKSEKKDCMCFVLLDPVYVPEALSMYYFGIVYIAHGMESTRSMNRLVSEIFKSLSERPGVTQKEVCQELSEAKLQEKFWPSRN